jgi:transcriptional regulator with XRE-family HTH domain
MDTSIKSPQELQAQLGQGIRTLRIGRQLTQRDLASKSGLSLKAVAQLERAEGSSVETLVRVLHALKATDLIENIAPSPRVSPLALLRSPRPLQRVRRVSPPRAA